MYVFLNRKIMLYNFGFGFILIFLDNSNKIEYSKRYFFILNVRNILDFKQFKECEFLFEGKKYLIFMC